MRFDEDTNTVHKCIHEGLDMEWCDCTDELRADLNVRLPRPNLVNCDSCSDEAGYVLTMTDSYSMDNLFYACRQCVADTMNDWLWSDLYRDISGWEIREL